MVLEPLQWYDYESFFFCNGGISKEWHQEIRREKAAAAGRRGPREVGHAGGYWQSRGQSVRPTNN
jgi:hypothetical protein